MTAAALPAFFIASQRDLSASMHSVEVISFTSAKGMSTAHVMYLHVEMKTHDCKVAETIIFILIPMQSLLLILLLIPQDVKKYILAITSRKTSGHSIRMHIG